MNKLIINNNPELPYAMEEALNSLRVNIGFLGKDIRKIMVISSTPNEGKSFVAMQLFRQFAQAGTKTVLIDADMRKSTMMDKYGMEVAGGEKIKGTSHVLAGDGDFNNAIYSTNIENGFILPNADNVVNPSMLLENNRFEELLNYAGENYRYTIVDSAPLDLVSDGERIGSLCDGAILVVRSGVTSKSMVRHSAMQLERAGCPLLGIVLNRVGSSKGKYYYGKKDSRYYVASK
ncbi:CpsD/CapB family tyrosine-protein kinase [Butyrivibrio sp. AE3004]|uniref:CpsD/CapB family tyrosine-protein kinase n=1 Tax=Butyrivibrio sp. AE3004 TaxID=1506994 RepID=UPI00049431B7|nr:CpsD/CapB family tyrosine-protein kinase [Butyrivibrio sp. AE3004]